MNKLLCLLLVVLGCSAADVSEEVGSVEQGLSTCSLKVSNPVRVGNQYTWRVTNVGSGCSAGFAARTELWKWCVGSGCPTGDAWRTLLFKKQPVLIGELDYLDFTGPAPATCNRSREYIVTTASWVPDGSTTRKYYVPNGAVACP